MPVKPNENEDHEAFMARCMADEETQADHEDSDEREIACLIIWDEREMEEDEPSDDTEGEDDLQPTPEEDESEEDFMARCMADEEMQTEFDDDEYRHSACALIWSKSIEEDEDHEGDDTLDPAPEEDEPEEDFMARCVADEEMQAKFEDSEERHDACALIWSEANEPTDDTEGEDNLQPTPEEDESEEDFMDRCMADEEMQTEFEDSEERHDACALIWSKSTEDTEEEESSSSSMRSNRLPATPDWKRLDFGSHPVGVDKLAKVVNGFIVAEEGPFKTEGRGEFDRQSLETIVQLMASEPKGLKSRFTHPGLSSDGLGKYLGRAKNPRIDVLADGRAAVRADLHLSETAFENNPNGNLGQHILDLAAEDPEALGASLVLKSDEEYRKNAKGELERDSSGELLPPLWRPEKLHAIDAVDTGDSTNSFLHIDGLPDQAVRHATEALNQQFAGASREVVKTRCISWLNRYLNRRFGDSPADQESQARHKAKLKILKSRSEN